MYFNGSGLLITPRRKIYALRRAVRPMLRRARGSEKSAHPLRAAVIGSDHRDLALRKASFNRVPNLPLQGNAVEPVDLLNAGGGGHIDFG